VSRSIINALLQNVNAFSLPKLLPNLSEINRQNLKVSLVDVKMPWPWCRRHWIFLRTVDNTSSRDYDGLGLVESYVEDEKTQVMTYVGTHSFNLTPIRIINMVNDFKLSKPNGKIILVGHSLGAYNIVQALKELNKINVSVDLVILLDTSNKKYNNYDFVVQKNVKNIINYTSPKWSDKLRFFTNSGGQVVLSEGNIYTNYSNLEIAGVEHTTIDNEITTLVINDIQNFLCRNSK
jgi:hypothetical protein